ncbi:MAG: hypothetical protein R2708_26920 [Vicinamibacterales bacterium]
MPVSPREIAAAEDDANRVVWEDREAVRFVTAEQAAAMPLRASPAAPACSGWSRSPTTTSRPVAARTWRGTGGIGLIAVTGWEKFKGGTRVEFRCGGRALGQLRDWRDAPQATGRVLSVSAAETGAGHRAAAG